MHGKCSPQSCLAGHCSGELQWRAGPPQLATWSYKLLLFDSSFTFCYSLAAFLKSLDYEAPWPDSLSGYV